MATQLLLFFQTKKLTIKAVTNAKKQQAKYPKPARVALPKLVKVVIIPIFIL